MKGNRDFIEFGFSKRDLQVIQTRNNVEVTHSEHRDNHDDVHVISRFWMIHDFHISIRVTTSKHMDVENKDRINGESKSWYSHF